ncbi:MAG: TlpA family protein disulfide reductase [Deltaproteobacteria bacterium]|nr:TlpA family protein disulfide reductase [Deltaproteobacteria bacterium]
MLKQRITPWLIGPSVLLAVLAAAVFLPGKPPLAMEDNPLWMSFPKKPMEALEFKTVDDKGNEVSLSDFKGKVVFLNFWATWCPPCVREMPAMERLQSAMRGQPFVILAMNQAEKPETVQKFKEKTGFTFRLLMDKGARIGIDYGANSLPMTYIIDAQGKIISRAVGPREWDGEAGIAWFRKLTGEQGRQPGESSTGAVNSPPANAPHPPAAAPEQGTPGVAAGN